MKGMTLEKSLFGFVNFLVVPLVMDTETRSLVELKYWIIGQSSTRGQEVRVLKNLAFYLSTKLEFS